MIKCKGCPIDAIHETDEERMRCVNRKQCDRAYQQGRADERKAHEETFEWCHECKEYDIDNNCCHRWSKVIRDTVADNYQKGREDAIDEFIWTMNMQIGIQGMLAKADMREIAEHIKEKNNE